MPFGEGYTELRGENDLFPALEQVEAVLPRKRNPKVIR
jgi:hypothetical protein